LNIPPLRIQGGQVIKRATPFTLLLLITTTAFAGGSLSPDIRISSDALGYDLQYRVYVPEGIEFAENLPVLFITDGPGYIQQGKVPKVLDRLINSAKIEPVVAVFVDSRDPDDLKINRRNQEFFCNADYLRFYVNELIPVIENAYPIARDRESRAILGVSFGGLNAACFGLLGYETFSGIGMHSPANSPVENLLPAYAEAPKLPLRIFLSTGSPNDNSVANRKFRKVLKEKGYDMKFIQTDAGHNWGNWRPLIDDVLVFFYAD
jgi:enterochelin esterase-like enzyme